MRKLILMLFLVASSHCRADVQAPSSALPNTPSTPKNPDASMSLGLNFYRSPLHADRGSMDDKSLMFDVVIPTQGNLTFTASIGRRTMLWNTVNTPISYSGTAYSFGARFYLGDPYLR